MLAALADEHEGFPTAAEAALIQPWLDED